MKVETLWIKFKRSGTEELKGALIERYYHLVKWVAYRILAGLPSHVDRNDLLATGARGLMKAVEEYDLSRKNKFETFAILLIRGAIIDELRSLDWVPRNIRDKASQIKRAAEALHLKLGREPDGDEMAEQMGLSVADYEQLRMQARPAIVLPLQDAPQLADPTAASVEDGEQKTLLKKAIARLPIQERKVIKLYYFEGKTLKEVGKKLGVGESRISQIHSKALASLRESFDDYFGND